MSRFIIVEFIYHRHKPIGLINKDFAEKKYLSECLEVKS
jgi:hypothetical protein